MWRGIGARCGRPTIPPPAAPTVPFRSDVISAPSRTGESHRRWTVWSFPSVPPGGPAPIPASGYRLHPTIARRSIRTGVRYSEGGPFLHRGRPDNIRP